MLSIALFFIARYLLDRYAKMDLFDVPEGNGECIPKHAYAFKCGVVSSRLCQFISKTVKELDLYFKNVADTHSSAKTLSKRELDEMESKVQHTLDKVFSIARLYADDCDQHAKDNKILLNQAVADCLQQNMEFHVIKHTWLKMVHLNGVIDKGLLSIANMNMFDEYLDDHYNKSVNEMNYIYQNYFKIVCDELEQLDECIAALGMDISCNRPTKPSKLIIHDLSFSVLERLKLLQNRCNSSSMLIRKFRV
ncbi:hypothetical protein INT47_012306 [Mucor saturninus]|uniref:Uncharacterized protein n=1 Tax=Mucor saturninus TaxID=64648 RepID=A0A8H7QGL3_9FUNG|nr:hypothetical protein INT47_012306 [Mucor saturninus]